MDKNMDNLVDAIRAALSDHAFVESRATGALACQTILAALQSKPGEQLATVPVTATPVQAAVAALRNTPPEQLLDFVILKLKATLPANVSVPPVQRINLPLLPINSLRGVS